MIISDEAEHGNGAQMHEILTNRHTKTTQQTPWECFSFRLRINDSYWFPPPQRVQNKVSIWFLRSKYNITVGYGIGSFSFFLFLKPIYILHTTSFLFTSFIMQFRVRYQLGLDKNLPGPKETCSHLHSHFTILPMREKILRCYSVGIQPTSTGALIAANSTF